jgi:hypothetical protein
MTITAEKILTRAIERWRTKGWIQREGIDGLGRTCLVGGIGSVANQLCSSQRGTQSPHDVLKERDKAIKAVAKVIGELDDRTSSGNRECIYWNDRPGRTVEEVIIAAEQARANLKRELDQ